MKHFEVVAAVILRNNQVFCAQRKDVGETAKKWEFPGGKVETDESHQGALAREIQEELNIQIQVKDYLMTVHHHYKTFSLTMHAYWTEIIAGELTLNEHLDSCWLSADQLKTRDWAAADIPIVEKLTKLLDCPPWQRPLA